MLVHWMFLGSILSTVSTTSTLTHSFKWTKPLDGETKIATYYEIARQASLKNITIPSVKTKHTHKFYLIAKKPQCTQMVTGLVLDKTSCSLPSYCSSIKFTAVNGTWWQGVTQGKCQGVSGKYMKIADHYGFDDNWWEFIKYELPTVHHGQDMMKPLFTYNDFGILFQHNLQKYMVMSKAAIDLLPMFDTVNEHLSYGGEAFLDGRWCSPRMTSDRLNHLTSPLYSSIKQLLEQHTFPYTLPQTAIYDPNVDKHVDKYSMLQLPGVAFHYFVKNHLLYMKQTQSSSFHAIHCDPYVETTSYLPIAYSYFSRVLSDTFWVLIYLIIDLVDMIKVATLDSYRMLNQHYYLSEYFLAYLIILYHTRNHHLSLGLLTLPFSYFGITRFN